MTEKVSSELKNLRKIVREEVNFALEKEVMAIAEWARELTKRVAKLEKEVRRIKRNFY